MSRNGAQKSAERLWLDDGDAMLDDRGVERGLEGSRGIVVSAASRDGGAKDCPDRGAEPSRRFVSASRFDSRAERPKLRRQFCRRSAAGQHQQAALDGLGRKSPFKPLFSSLFWTFLDAAKQRFGRKNYGSEPSCPFYPSASPKSACAWPERWLSGTNISRRRNIALDTYSRTIV